MGTPADFLELSSFAGTRGRGAFSQLGTVNTDDNLYLEFSAPRSVAVGASDGRQRRGPGRASARRRARSRPVNPAPPRPWLPDASTTACTPCISGSNSANRSSRAFRIGCATSTLDSRRRGCSIAWWPATCGRCRARWPTRDSRSSRPTARRRTSTSRPSPCGRARGRAALLFVDNAEQSIYGETYLAADEAALDARIAAVAADVLSALDAAAAELTARTPSGRPGSAALRERARAVGRRRGSPAAGRPPARQSRKSRDDGRRAPAVGAGPRAQWPPRLAAHDLLVAGRAQLPHLLPRPDRLDDRHLGAPHGPRLGHLRDDRLARACSAR